MSRPPKARLPLKHAALELFVEQGVHGTGIREIAKHAGCSEAALYRHWHNKEAMVDALFREHLGEVRSALESAIAGQAIFIDKVRAACAACYSLYDEHPLVFRFILLVQHELARHLPTDLRMPQDVVTDLIASGMRDGELQGGGLPHDDQHTAPLLAAAVIGVFLETAVFVLYGRLPGPLSLYIDAVTATAMRVLKR